MILSLRVYGLPVAQGRPRAFKTPAGQVRVYDPASSRDWKRTVLHQVLPHKPVAPVEGPLAMALTFYLPRPKSKPKRVIHHTTKPDADNLAKSVKDALRGIVYRDDSQIVELVVRKLYGVQPGVQIRVDEVLG